MRVLILGGSGMLGHKLWQVFRRQFDTHVTLRQPPQAYPTAGLFEPARTLAGVNAEDFTSVAAALERCRPDVVVNAIGVVKQRPAASDPLACINVNAGFPHRLAKWCREGGCRLIHVSSDCVFSGRRGNYREDDVADPVDLYGRSKLLGEIDQPGCLTIRTSIIGRELGTSHGLIEWFLRQEGGSVAGYRQVIFSGLTTRALAELLARVIVDQPQLWGVWHIASEPISKYELLLLVRSIYGVGVEVRPDDSQRCNRSLDGRRFGQATGLVPPRWPAMLEQMCA